MDAKQLQKIAEKIRPVRFLDYRSYLKAIYQQVKSDKGSYSYQQFAKDLGFGASTVIHQIVKGYRPLTPKTAGRIMIALGIKGKDRQYFLTLLEFNNAKKVKDKDAYFQKLLQLKSETLPTELDQNLLSYFSEWYHPVIREMVGLPGFASDPKWISKKLVPRVPADQIKKSLKLLENLGMISRDPESGEFKQTQTVIDSGSGVKGMGLLGYHQAMLDRAKDSLTSVKAKRRNISAVTVRCSEERAKKLKSMIQAFQSELMQVAEAAEETEEGDQIYQINLQLFPFTEES